VADDDGEVLKDLTAGAATRGARERRRTREGPSARTLEALRWAQAIVERAYPDGQFVSTVFESTASIMVYGPGSFSFFTQLGDGEDGVDLGARVLFALDRAIAHDRSRNTSG
jgi:hypothetical protein